MQYATTMDLWDVQMCRARQKERHLKSDLEVQKHNLTQVLPAS